MNQILITEKLYVTPELKRKKKLYKIDFFISVFLLCFLFSYYIYAEYDRYKGQEVSEQLLANMTIDNPTKTFQYDNTTVKLNDDSVVVILDDADSTSGEISTIELEDEVEKQKADEIAKNIQVAKDGTEYYKMAVINIPKINISYAVLSTTTPELLKMSPCKFWGGEPNEVGNFCIIGHNYRNTKFFSKVPTLENGDIIELVDLSGRKIQYEVYYKTVVPEGDTKDTSQLTNGRKEVTLITCTNDSKNRVIVKAKEVI